LELASLIDYIGRDILSDVTVSRMINTLFGFIYKKYFTFLIYGINDVFGLYLILNTLIIQ